MGRESEFVRTPKLGVEGRGQTRTSKGYRAARNLLPAFEVGLGLYYTHAVSMRSSTTSGWRCRS